MEEQTIDLSLAQPPSGGLQDTDKIQGWRGDTPVMVSPLQLRELVGVDHSLLTEQIVPGEFWADLDGVRRQVYTRTFAGTLAITEDYYRVSLLPDAMHVPIDMFGYVLVGHWNDEVTVPNQLIRAMVWGLYGISLEFDPSLLGKQYCVTVKYIKR